MSDERRETSEHAKNMLVDLIGAQTNADTLRTSLNLLDYIASLEADRARLDWMEAHAREGRDDNDQQTRVEFIHGMPGVPGATQESGFYVRQWSETPDDAEGNPDFRRRSYRQSPTFATLRDALDAALSSSPLAPTQEDAT